MTSLFGVLAGVSFSVIQDLIVDELLNDKLRLTVHQQFTKRWSRAMFSLSDCSINFTL